MKFGLLRILKNVGWIAACVLTAALILLILPTVARAEEPAATETAQQDEAPVEDGSAAIGEVTVTDGTTGITQTVDTEPELQKTLGTPDDTSLEYDNTAASNAIQQAIDAALSYADGNLDIKSMTVVVDDGTYNGGLNISKKHTVTSSSGETSEAAYTLAEDFILQIVASDAKGDGGTLTSSAGGAGMNGTVNIEDMNVLIAGLYFVTGSVVNVRSGKVSIYGTTRDDTISTDLCNGAQATIDGGDGNDDISVSGTLGTSMGNDPAAVQINGGGGDDTITVDTSLALNAGGRVSVNADGSEGADRLHLTGTLQQGGAHSGTRTGVNDADADITLVTSALEGLIIKELDVDTASIEAYTDALLGKSTVHLASTDQTLTSVQSFTDYIVDHYNGGKLSIQTPDGAKPLLTSLVLSGDEFTVGTVTAPAFNVVIEGKRITVTGTVTGRNISITATDSDVQLDLSADFDSSLMPDFSFEFSLFDFVSNAYIIIEENAGLVASETVTLLVTSTQTKPLVPDPSELADKIAELTASGSDPALLTKLQDLAVNPNFINVKVGSAVITVKGTVMASQAIKAAAKTTTSMTVTNEDLAKWCIPLGISVAVAKAVVMLCGNAVVTSTHGGVALSAVTDVTVNTKAATGAIPIALAVSVVTADAHVSVKDNARISASGDVTMNASGTVAVETIASVPAEEEEEEPAGGSGSGGAGGDPASDAGTKSACKSGGFFAVSVVVQNVSVSVTGNASINAGAIELDSASKQTVITKASSQNEAENEQEGEEESSMSLTGIIDMLKGLFGKLSGSDGSEPMVSDEAAGALEGASQQMAPEQDAGAGSGSEDEDMGLGDLFNEEEEEPAPAGVTDTFDQGTAGATDTNQTSGSSSSTQLVGALAVTYAGNANAAVIKTTGSIISAGVLRAQAIAEQAISTVADGSPLSAEEEAAQEEATEESTAIEGGTITTENGAKPEDKPEISYHTGAEAPAITGGTLGTDGTVTATGTTVTIDGVTITITGGKTVISNATGIKKGAASITVPTDPITITGGTTTVEGGKLTIKGASLIKITNGVLTITGGTVTMEGGTAANDGGTVDIPSSDLVYDHVTIHDIDSFGAEITNGLADSDLPSATTVTGLKDKSGAAATKPNLSTAKVTGGGAEITDGTASFASAGSGISVKVIGGNRSADGSVVTAADVEITGATLTISSAYLTLTNGTVTGCKLADGSVASITGGVIKYVNGTVTITGATIRISMVRVSITGPDTGKTITLSGGKITIGDGTTTVASGTGTPATTASIADATLTTDPVTPKKGGSSFALGVGVSVCVVRNTNTAYIEAGTLKAGSIALKADTSLNSEATAKAGVSECDIGIAGAAAVHVVSSKTNARIGSDVTVAGGAVTVEATQKSDFTTSAEATGDGEAGKLGVGAGLAIAVIGCDVSAIIPDGIEIKLPEGTDSIEELSLNAAYEGTESLTAAAGVAGGISIVPVLALGVSGVSTNAYLGTGVKPVIASHDVLISASNDIARTMGADAAASGSGVGFGAALSIGVFNDNATAKLNRSVAARNVSVKATAKNSLKSTAKAGANGATDSEGETSGSGESGGGEGSGGSEDPDPAGGTDKTADKNVQSAGSLANSSGTNNVNSNSVNSLSANRQTAQTSEGNIKIAAGFALNIQKNVALASIGDGLTITATAESGTDDTGIVSVQSINKTDAEISANASATQSAIGVGVAVAINIVTYENIAEIGKSAVTARVLILTAQLPEKPEDEEEAAEEAAEDTSLKGRIVGIVKQFVNDILSEMSASIGLKDLFGTEDFAAAISDLVEEIATDIIDTMLDGTGLENLFNGDIEQMVSEALASIQNLPGTAFAQIKGIVKTELLNKLKSLIPGSGSAEASGLDGLSAELKAAAQEIITQLTENFINIEELRAMLSESLVETIKTKLTTIAQDAVTDIANAAAGILAGWAGTDAAEPYGHTISTEAISGAGASSVGVAGAAAIAVVNATTRASIASTGTALASDMNIAEAVTILADAVHIIKTVSSSAVGDNGKADKNKDATANANGDAAGGSKPADTSTTPSTGADSGGAPVSPGTTNGAGSGKSVGLGASFSFNYIHANVEAFIGTKRVLTAGTLVLKATLENKIETVSVSGSDPLAGTDSADKTDKAKDISLDASAAVGLIYNTVRALVDTGAIVTLTGGSVVNISDTEGDDYAEYVNLYIFAKEKGATITRASGFTVGNATAVGAAVAVNIATSNVSAAFKGTGVVAGAAKILAQTFNEDDSNAIATAMGGDLDRYLSKFRGAQSHLEESTNQVLAGDYSNAETGNESNQTASTINGELNNNSNAEQGGTATPATNNAPLSSNALNTQNAGTQSTPNTTEGSNAVSGNASNQNGTAINATPGAQTQQSQKIRVAAAVAVNITIHSAIAEITGSLTAAAVKALAVNNGNFAAMGTGAAISLDNGGNSIGIGVAVSVNKNEAVTTLGGSIAATGDDKYDNDITAEAQLTQNMDGRYKGLLGAQALAGAVTGTGSKFCISAALAVVVSLSKCKVTIAENTAIHGGDIAVSASDKSKLAVRAGGLSLSTGASVGAGVSFALIFAHNEVSATVGNGASITGRSFTLSARKLKVDFSDYQSEFGLNNMLTADAKEGDKGIVNLVSSTDADGNKSYQTEIRFDTDSVLGIVNLLNFLSSTNYYAESISGAVNTGASGKLTASGSFAFVFFFNNTRAIIGDSVSILLTGDADVTASSDTTARVIAGAISVSSSQVGIGATVGAIANNDTVTASVGTKGTGSGTDIGGTFAMSSTATMDMMLITTAAGASATGNAVGGSIDVIVSENNVQALVADGAFIQADGGINIGAGNDAFLLFIALSLAGSGGKAALGGTFAVLVTGNSAKATVGDGVTLRSDNGSVRISAANKETLISILASASGSTGGTTVAGTLNVQITRSAAQASVGNGVTIAAAKDIAVEALSDTFMLTIVAALTGSAGGAAIGATINVNVFTRSALALVGNGCSLTATNGDIVVRALAQDWLLTLTAAGAASASSVTIAGSIPVVVGDSTVRAIVGERTTAHAGGSVGIIANLDSHIYVPAISVSVSGGSMSAGATVNTVVLQNLIEAILCGGCTVTAGAATAGLDVPNRTVKRKGVIVSATASETMYLISVSGAVSAGSAAIAGVVNTLVVKNTVRAQIRSREVNTAGEETTTGEHSVESGGEVLVDAEDDSSILDIAGGLAASAGSVGVGATAVVLVFDKSVTASIGSFGTVTAAGAVTVSAKSDDDLYLFAISFGVASSVGVAGGVNVALFQNHVTASLGGTVGAASVSVTADSDVLFVNTAAGAAGGGTVGVAAVFVVSYLYNQTLAYITTGAVLTASGSVTITAASIEDVYAIVAGGGAAGTVGVSGTVDLAITKVVTKAYTQSNVAITAGSLSVTANDTFSLLGVAGSLGGGGTVGVGISALVVVAFNTIEASIGANNTIRTTTGNVEVKATSDRSFDAYSVTAGAGGTVGVSGAVAVVVAGSQLTKDTAGVFKESGDGRIVPQTQVDAAFTQSNPKAKGYGTNASTGDMLESNGQGSSDYNVDGGSFGSSDEESKDDNEQEADRVTDNMNGSANETANIGGSAPTYNLKDTTSAYIAAGTTVTSAGSITVEAQDTFRVDMITGAIAVGSITSVGVGLAVAVLNSNVMAFVQSGVTLSAQGSINVTAKAGSEALAADADQTDRKDSLLGRVDDLPGISDYTVRVITVSAGGALVGVNVALCAVSLFTQTHAYIAGNVIKADSLNVTARSDFGRVMAVTLGIGGGLVAVNGSITLIVYQGVVEASICSAARISNATTINVKSYSNTTANAWSMSLGGGGVAVNAAAAIAINLTRVDTFIAQGVVISGATNVTVTADIDAGAGTVILSAAAGGVAAGATVAVTVLRPTVLTYIGVTPTGTALTQSQGSGGQVTASGTVTVKNDVSGNATATGLSFAGGTAGALNGTVALALNFVTGYAAISKANISANHIDVSALMDGDATVTAAAATISGSFAMGLIIGIALVTTDNRALIDLTGSAVTATGTISVNAGRDGLTGTGAYDSTASADVTTATVSATAITVNVALTINSAANRALVQGTSGTMNAGSLVVFAKGTAQASTIIRGINAGAASIALSVAVALLKSQQEAKLSGNGTVTLGALTVQSYQNTGKANDTYDAKAQVWSGGGGLLSATAFITIVRADATGIASAAATSLTVAGAITVQSFARSYAGAFIDKVSVGFLSIGIMYGRAYAKGTFGAYLGSDGASINANGVTVYTEYSAYANADVNPATGGFNASYISVTGNMGQAEVDTHATSAISGSGTVTSSGAVSVKTHGTVSAYAIVHGATVNVSKYSIAVNVATAQLSAVQTACIEDATVRTTGSGAAGDVTILSEYNATAQYTGAEPSVPSEPNSGAVALVGACGGSVSLSVATGEANVATANSASSSSAFVHGASTDIAGTLRVESFGTSYANADTERPTLTVSLVNVAISTTVAGAAGSYSAYIDSTGSAASIKAGAITVNTRYNTKAVSKICPGGGLSGSVSLVSVNSNVATSNASTHASAYFAGSGAIVSGSTINVTVRGTALADAAAKEADISVSGVSVAANVTYANLLVVQSAYFNVTGTAAAAGAIIVSSVFDADANHGAKAVTGSPNPKSGVSISLIGGKLSMAVAKASLVNKAYLSGSGTISGGSIAVGASAVTRATADANSSVSVSLIGVGSLYAEAYTQDDIQAYIGNGTKVITTGDTSVNANGNTTADASCDTPGSVSLADVSGARVLASVGKSDKNQSVKAYIGSSADVMAGGNITLAAFNDGYATANISQGTNVSGVSIKTCIVQTEGYYYTEVSVGNSAKLKAGGNITLTAEDSPEARTTVSGTNVGILVSGGNMYAKNTLTQRVLASIGIGASLSAGGGITVGAISNATMYAKTNVNKGGIIDTGSLQAYNTIANRDVDLTVGNGASLTADYGNISLTAQSGLSDNIYTSAVGTAGGLVTISDARAESKVTAHTDVTIGAGVTITDTFNTVTIAAYHGAGSIQTLGDFGSGGLSSNPKCRAYVNTFTSSANVTIAGTPVDGCDQTVIVSRYVKIYSSLKNMYLYAYTHAVTAGLHGTAKAYSTITTNMENTIVIGSAHIKGYDAIEIIASANPTSSGNNIEAYAGTKITAFVGKIVSEAITNGSINAGVSILAGADITGANVRIDANKFAGTVSLTAYGKRRAIASKDTTEEDNISRGRSVSVSANAKFHIGDAAAGIVIDIAANGTVRAVGIPNEAVIWSVSGGNVTFTQTIQNAVAGKLYVGGLLTLASSIFDQQYISEITIINHSNLNLVIKGIDSFNESYSRPSVTGVLVYVLRNGSENTTPVVSILSYGSGNVTIGQLSGVLANERGTTNILWLGETGGSLYAGKVMIGSLQLPALWTHILNVQGAVNIGASDSSRFNAYLTLLDGQNADINLAASGNIFASLTLAEISAVSSLSTTPSTAALGGTLYLENVKAGGVCDILLPYAVRLEYLAGASAVSLVIPGVLEFSADKVTLAANITIDDLSRYLSGLNPADMSLGYTLPNDVQVYTDASGKVLRIVSSGGTLYDFTNYVYSVNGSNQLIITLLRENIAVNLSTGMLTVLGTSEDESSKGFELYLGMEGSVSWLGWYLGEGSIGSELGYQEDIIGEDSWVLTDHLWKSVDGIDYYLVYSDVWASMQGRVYNIVGLRKINPDDPDSQTCVACAFRAQLVQHASDVVTGSVSTSTDVSGGVTTTVTTYTITFSNFAGSGAALTYSKSITVKTWKEGSTDKSSTETSYGHSVNLGLSLTTTTYGGATVERVANASGLTGSALVTYNKLQGVLWGFTATEDSATAYKGKLTYYTIDKIDDIAPSTITHEKENDDDEEYSYDALVFIETVNAIPVAVRRIMISEVMVYTVGSKQYEIDLDQFQLSFDLTSGFFHFTITGGGTITLMPGDSVKLYGSNGIYRLTKDLYIGSDGTVYFNGVSISGGVIATSNATCFNGSTGRFESPEVSIANTNNAGAAGAVTLKPGTIRLEMLSADVAKDAAGNYYWYNGSAWVAAAYADGVISFGGATKLTITVVDGITYHTLPSGFVLGSDGSIRLPESVAETAQRTAVTESMVIPVGYIEGSAVAIILEGSTYSLTDDDTTGDIDIRAAGRVTIISASSGSIGTADNALEIAGGSLYFENLAGEDTLSTDTYIEVTQGSIVLDGGSTLSVDGCTLLLTAPHGGIRGSGLALINGGAVTLSALSDIVFDTVEAQALSQLTLNAGGGIRIDDRFEAYDSTVDFDAAGGDIVIAVSDLNNSSVTLTASGAMVLTLFDAEDSAVTLSAGAALSSDTFSIAGGTLDMGAGGDIRIDTFSADGTVAVIGAGGGITMESCGLTGGSLDMDAASDIKILAFCANGTPTAITAGGGIAMESCGLTGGSLDMDAAGDINILALSINGTPTAITAGGGIVMESCGLTGGSLDMDATDDISILALSGSGTPTAITAGGGITMESCGLTGGSLDMDATGDINILAFCANGTPTAITAGGGIAMETCGLTGDAVTMHAGLDADIDALTVDGARLSLAADGKIDFVTVSIKNASNATVRAGGALICTAWMTVVGSTADITSGGAMRIAVLTASGSDITVNAGGSFESDRMSATGSTVAITAGAGITAPQVSIASGTFTATAKGDIALDEFYASDSRVTLISTAGAIMTADGDSYIKITGTGSALTLSALGDIGSAAVHVRLDIPAEVVLHITHVDDYYIDAMHIPAPAPLPNPVYTGTDGNGNAVTNNGEILNEYVGAIGSGTVGIDFDSFTPEQWAQRLMGTMSREQWLALIAEGSIRDLVLSGGIDAATLSAYLFDNTITPVALAQMLSIPHDAPEWQNTLNWLNSVEAQLRALLISTEGQKPTKKNNKVITDEMETALLALLIKSNTFGEINPALALTPEEMAQLASRIAQDMLAKSSATQAAASAAARAFNVLVGESTGSAYVTNEGDICITQQTGNMTVGRIDSARGNVSLTALDAGHGDIRGANTGTTHIEARNIALSAAGSIGGASQPLVIDGIANRIVVVYNVLATRFKIGNIGTADMPQIRGHLESDVRYDWLRTYEVSAATRLDAASGGEINLAEVRGDIGLGFVTAPGSVTLKAQRGVYDVRSSGEAAPNVTAAKLTVTALTGGIGTAAAYIRTAISGDITASAYGDIFVGDTGDMTMTADSAIGEVSASAQRDMTLRNTAGSLRLGKLEAGGFARVTSTGSVAEGNRQGAAATIKANGMAFVAAGDIGEAANLFEVDTGSGTFSADAHSLYAAEVSGDIRIQSVRTTGMCVITTPGNILDANGTAFDEALEAQKEANDAHNTASEAQAKAAVLQAFADRIKAILDAADLAAQTAQDSLDSASLEINNISAQLTAETDALVIAALQARLKDLQTMLPGLNKALNAAQAAKKQAHDTYDAPWISAQGDADAAWTEANRLKAMADAAQTYADSLRLAADSTPRTISSGSDLILRADGSVGENGRALTIHADGPVTIAAGGSVHIGGGSVTRVAGIQAGGSVSLTMMGSIVAAGVTGPVIIADSLDINALWNDIGERAKPLLVSVGTLSVVGANIYIVNNKPLVIDEMFAQGSADIEAKGSIASGSADTNITADSLKLSANGSIGTAGKPLELNVRELTAQGGSIVIRSISETLTILSLHGGAVVITASGNVAGSNIYVTNLRINAFGSIGSEENPLGIFTNGAITLSSEKGLMFYRNLLKAHYRQWQKRQLESHYLTAFFVKIPFALRQRGGDASMAIYIGIGLRADGTWDIYGLWIGKDYGTDATDDEKAEAAEWSQGVLEELKERGIESIDIAFVDGLTGFSEALTAVFPETQQSACTLVWMMNTSQQIAEEDREALLTDLNAVYAATTAEAATKAYEQLIAAWSTRYPDITQQMKESWPQWSESFSRMKAARDAGFDLNAIEEALNAMAEATGERYTNSMDAVYRVFIQVLNYSPKY